MFSSVKFGWRFSSSFVETLREIIKPRVVPLVVEYQSINHTIVSHSYFSMANNQGDQCSTRNKVYVYSGYGCSDQGSKMLTATLNKHVDKDHHGIIHISPEDIVKGNWMQDAQMLVIGGGFDLGFIKSLGPEGIKLIHDYVWVSGGRYLGICAGAYFASDSIEFDKGGPIEVCGERQLKFYPGQCIGPAYPGFEYNTSAGAEAAPLDVSCHTPWANKMESTEAVYIYIDGGGFFTIPDNNQNSGSSHLDDLTESKSVNGVTNGEKTEKVSTEILAKFRDLPNSPPAIVKCDVGANGGKAILSCVHFEYDPELLNTDDPTLKASVKSKVVKTEVDRLFILTAILEELGIKTNGI